MPLELTIVTTTYNRATFLKRCYESLCAQTSKKFEWIIIDDGSTDETYKIVKEIQNSKNDFPVFYYKKKNAGKHTALNYSHPYINGNWVLMLDDDDILALDAVETILLFCQQYNSETQIGCLSFQRGTSSDAPLVDWKADSDIVSNTIDFRINAKRFGDCAEVIRSHVLKKYPFPVFKGERFLAEDHLWIKSAYEYDTVYIRKVIYMTEYHEGGLTKSGRKMRLRNPIGGMYSSKLYFNKRFKLSIRIRKAILFNVYALATKEWFIHYKEINSKALCVFTFPAGLFFYLKWK